MKSPLLKLGFCRLAAGTGCAIALGLLPLPRAGAVEVLTQHNDVSRAGANLAETILTPTNVNSGQFGKLFTRSVDGQIYAQPLYVQGLTISNQTHNVVFVCTEHNSVYAFDADDPAASNALWQVNLGPSVPYTAVNSCSDLKPEIGITSTPVIDLGTGTIYVEAKTMPVSGTFYHNLHALDITTGQEKFGGPTNIQGTVGGITFNAQHGHQRAGLLLLSNVVYVAMSSHCDWEPYNGWMFGYNATNLSQVAIFNTTPGSANGEGAIWSCGMAPAADTNGNIYVMTGNGLFDATNGNNYGQCFLKLSTTNGLAVADWFSPWNEATLSGMDRDIGTGGAVLLPDHLLTGMDKKGTMYVLDQNRLGHMSLNGTSDTNIVEEFPATLPVDRIGQSPVYWNGPSNQLVFMSCGNTNTLTYIYTNSLVKTNVLAVSATKQGSAPGGISLSANGSASGILWVIDSGSGGTLRAYDAANMPNELWDSQQNPGRDALGGYVKFCSPTIANGKVYAPTTNHLVVYGLLNSVTPTLLWSGGSGTDTNWSTALNWTNITVGGNGPPGPTDNLLFTNTALAASAGSTNNVVDTNITVDSLQYANNATNTSPNYHVTLIANGRTLTITNGLSAGTGTDAGSNAVVNAAITGAGGMLVLNGGALGVNQGSGGDGPHQAVLNLSGLGNLIATNVSRIAIGVYQVPAGAPRACGILFLAKTNTIALTSTGVTNGVLVGWNDSSGNGNSSGLQNAADQTSTLYLGQTNAIFTDAIYVGTDKCLGSLMAFNPAGLNNPVAFFRNRDGVSRISLWGIGDTSMKNGSNQSASGTNDFSGGTVDALVASMSIGVTQTGASSGTTGNGTGVLTFNSGTIDVNNLTNGWSVGIGTTGNTGTGTINVNDSATLKVNKILTLAAADTVVSSHPSGTVNVDGGTLIANTVIAGAGASAINLNNATLIVTNSIGAPILGALTTFSTTNSTLHLRVNGTSIITNIVTFTLNAAGVNTIVIDSVANVGSATNFPLVAYNSFNGSVAANFVKGALPAGFSASLVDNVAQHRIDLSIAASTNVVPRIGAVMLSGTNFIFGGSNGLPKGNYYVLTSSNVALPLSAWTPLATNPFDVNGGFNFTNPINTNGQLFYLLQLP